MAKKKANKQPSKQQIVDGFKPSTGEEGYLQGDKTKQEWEVVRAMWVESRDCAHRAVSLFMDMGDILIKLRDGSTDPQFGKMRKVHVPELTRQDALRAMNLARNRDRFTIEGPTPSISVMAELVNASDKLVEEVLSDNRDAKTSADKDKKAPTVKEVREKVKAEKPETAEEFADSMVDEEPDDEDLGALEHESELLDIGPLAERVETALAMTHPQRVKLMAEEELDTFNAFLVLGFNPLYDGDYPCAREVFYCAVAMHLEHCSEEDARITNHCAKMLEEEVW
jgi:hypothetical protein